MYSSIEIKPTLLLSMNSPFFWRFFSTEPPNPVPGCRLAVKPHMTAKDLYQLSILCLGNS